MSFVKKNILWFIFSLLLFASMVLYFVVANRYILATDSIAFFDQSTDIEKVYSAIKWPDNQKNKIRVIYFWQAYCPCDATVMPHFKELYKEHAKDSIDFYLSDLSPIGLSPVALSSINLSTIASSTTASSTTASSTTASSAKYDRPFDHILNEGLTDRFRPFVSHTPAVAIWNENNELTYYGPHSLGYVCNTESSFVKKVIDSLLQNIHSKNTNIVGDGCFCKV